MGRWDGLKKKYYFPVRVCASVVLYREAFTELLIILDDAVVCFQKGPPLPIITIPLLLDMQGRDVLYWEKLTL